MKILPYKEVQKLASPESEVEARMGYIVPLTMGANTFRILYFIEVKIKDPENPFIVIKDTTGAVEYAGPMSEAKEQKWFSTYQAAFEPEAEWWVRD